MVNTKPSTIRTLEENSYYHGCVVKEISNFKHWPPAHAHAWVKATFGVKTTTTLTTGEFEELMKNVRDHVKRFWKLKIEEPTS